MVSSKIGGFILGFFLFFGFLENWGKIADCGRTFLEKQTVATAIDGIVLAQNDH